MKPTAAVHLVGLAGLLAGTIACASKGKRPPPGDCAAVAELLVSLEVGNYASREERAANLPAKRTLCEQQRISADEASCLAKVSDIWSAGGCVPRLFPRAEGSECQPVMARIRGALGTAMGTDPSAAAMLAKMMTILDQSCVEDEWPEAMRRCFLEARAGDLQAFIVCEKVTPPALKVKIEQRMRDLSP